MLLHFSFTVYCTTWNIVIPSQTKKKKVLDIHLNLVYAFLDSMSMNRQLERESLTDTIEIYIMMYS